MCIRDSSQTIARIGTGLSTMGALCWLLWPTQISVLNNPEAIFAFGTAFVIWLLTEFKLSEEIHAQKKSVNDISLSQELLGL